MKRWERILAEKRQNRLILALVAVAVALCLLAAVFSDTVIAWLGGTGVRMEYETKLFNPDKVLSVDIRIDEDTWKEILRNPLAKEYYPCDVVINGQRFYHVGLRTKGNTSLSSIAMDPNSDRYSFKLEFDHYVKGQTCYGLDKLILNNNYADATNMKEAIVYDLYRYMDADASLTNYAKLSVNGEYYGVYLALEGVEQSFLLRNYGVQDGELYKPETMGMGAQSNDEPQGPGEGFNGFPGADFGGNPGQGDRPDFGDGQGNEPQGFPGQGDGPDFGEGQGPSQSEESSSGGNGPQGNSNNQSNTPNTDESSSGGNEAQNNPEQGNPFPFNGSESQGFPSSNEGNQSEGSGESSSGGNEPDPGFASAPDGPFSFDKDNKPGGGPFGGDGFPQGGPFGGNRSSGADLNYSDDALDSYSAIWDGEITKTGKSDHRRVVEALKNIHAGTDLEAYLDMDAVLRYMAVHTFAVNADSLSGSMAHNYYLYESKGKPDRISNDFPNTRPGDSPRRTEGSATGKWLTLGACLLILLAAIFVTAIYRRKR